MSSSVQPTTILCVYQETNSLLVTKWVLELAGYRVHATNDRNVLFECLRDESLRLVVLGALPAAAQVAICRNIKGIRPDVRLLSLAESADAAAEAAHSDLSISAAADAPEILARVAELLRAEPSSKLVAA